MYSVTATTTYEGGKTCSADAEFPVTVNPNPVLSVIGNDTICSGGAAQLEVQDPNQDTDYKWSLDQFGIDVVETGSAFSVTLTTNSILDTTYYVIATNSYDGGFDCYTSLQVPVRVYSLPDITFVGPDTICRGDTVTIKFQGADVYFMGGCLPAVPRRRAGPCIPGCCDPADHL